MLAKPLALLLSITLLASLGFVPSALAQDALGDDPGAAFLEEECELGEPDCVEELDFEECEEAEDGEGLECEEEPEPLRAGEAPADCLLTSARPRVSISGGQGRLKLDVRYEVSAPAEVSVSLRSAGGKGTVAMPPERLRLSRGGVFHETLELNEEETERALSAREFSVRLRVADVPSSCRRYELRHLTVKRGGEESPVFSAPSPNARSSRAPA